MLEQYLIEHCSPTLASIKTANLFSLPYKDEEELARELEIWNETILKKGVALILLRKSGGRALVYVCRKKKLQQDFLKAGVWEFLLSYGYSDMNADSAIGRLEERIAASKEFPHEIGLFLGYPLEDVVGFIENAGKNPKCTGCWKVYCNEWDAIKIFALYKKCTQVYTRLWKNGRTVWQLTVAA